MHVIVYRMNYRSMLNNGQPAYEFVIVACDITEKTLLRTNYLIRHEQ